MYTTCIIDPPWPYRKVTGKNNLSGFVSHEGNRVHYDTLTIEDMKKLPVGEIVSGYLLMWTAGPFIREGLELFDAWGFEYKTNLCWHKKPGLGVGYWFRGDHELVLVGKKPGLPSVRTGERSCFVHPRIGHSSKPSIVHELVEKHFEGPFLEIFGRKGRDGWTVAGNEAPEDGQDIRVSLASLRDLDLCGNVERCVKETVVA